MVLDCSNIGIEGLNSAQGIDVCGNVILCYGYSGSLLQDELALQTKRSAQNITSL
jgi:hypothetical protein